MLNILSLLLSVIQTLHFVLESATNKALSSVSLTWIACGKSVMYDISTGSAWLSKK
jgi:hypothetical protein